MSFWLFYVYNIEDPYYNAKIGLFFKIITTYYFWTNVMLLVSLILFGTSFAGGLVAWLTGIFLYIKLRFAIYSKYNDNRKEKLN